MLTSPANKETVFFKKSRATMFPVIAALAPEVAALAFKAICLNRCASAANHASFAGQIWLWVPCWQLCSLPCLCLHTAQTYHRKFLDHVRFAMLRRRE